MVEIFKTDVQNKMQARLIMKLLQAEFTHAKINFDLDDCDKVLRIEGIDESLSPVIVNDLKNMGFQCEILM